MSSTLTYLPGFDLADALERFSEDQATLIKYVRLLIQDFNKRLPDIQTALSQEDWTKAQQQFHTLAGTAAALSATALMALCQECELLCSNNGATRARAGVDRIQLNLRMLESYL